MRKLAAGFITLLMLAGFAAGCTGDGTTEITVSAAASLKDALGEIQETYNKRRPEVKVTFNFGSSGTLQQQIEQGAPVDLFISAGKRQMDALEEKQLLVKESRVSLLGNELVLIVGKDNNTVNSFFDLSKAEVKHIGIGQPASVPAGKYAKEALISMGIWDNIKSKCVEAKDVRQVLSYVETEAAEAGLVYKSDAIISDRVKIAAVASVSSHKPIVYPAAVIKSAKNGAAADEFLKFLGSEEAKQIFIRYGFKDLKQ